MNQRPNVLALRMHAYTASLELAPKNQAGAREAEGLDTDHKMRHAGTPLSLQCGASTVRCFCSAVWAVRL